MIRDRNSSNLPQTISNLAAVVPVSAERSFPFLLCRIVDQIWFVLELAAVWFSIELSWKLPRHWGGM